DAEASVGAVTISAGGKFGLKSENHMDASAIADGSAAKGLGKDGKVSDTAVGVAVAMNVADMESQALVASGATVTSDGASIEALMKGGAQKHEFAAKATSGGSGGDTGVAGSFALNIVTDADTQASLASGATLNAGTGTVTLKAQNTTESIVDAKASAEAGNTGVGVSVGINVAVENDTRALVQGTLNGGGDLAVEADGSHVVNTTAAAGGLSKGGTGVGGGIAITVADNATEASISSGTALNVSGKVDANAQHHGASATTADGKSSGGTAVGAAIALSFVDDSAKAATARDITAGGAVSFTASADSASKAQAIASAAGTDKAQEDGKGKKSSDDQQKSTTDLANAKSGSSKTSGQKANTDSKGEDSGSVGVAAALALNVASSDAEASVGAVTISAGGKFGLKSENHMDASAIADGSAAKGLGKDGKVSDTAVGVAVA